MLKDLRNRIDFFIREKTRFSRKNYKLKSKYNVESEYVFSLLENYFEIDYSENISVLDIGSKNWAYVMGEFDYFKDKCTNLFLDGVEIDSNRLYFNFFSRYEVAKAYIKNLKNVNYISDNLLNLKNKKYDYIIWLLPFVTTYPLEKWGLPKRFFMPEKLLEHAYNLLNKKMIIINQTEEEFIIQEKMLKAFGYKYKPLGEIEIKNSPYVNKRFGFVVYK